MAKTNLLLIVAGALLAGLIAGGCTTPEKQTIAADSQVTEAIPVVAVTVRSEPFQVTKEYSGTLEGSRQTDVIAKVTEQILEIPVEIGDAVKAGQLVAKLDRSGISSRYHQAESSYLNAKRNAERMQALLEAGAISRQTLDDAKTQFDVAQAEFDAAKSLVDLTSSIAGIVTAIHYSEGDVTAPGKPVVTVATLDEMELVFYVSDSDLPFMKLGSPVEIFSELRPDLKLQGSLVKLSRSADASTRTFEVKARFANTDDQWFRPGMFGIAQVSYTTEEAKLTIPRTALVNREGDYYVYRIEDETAKLQPITVEIAGDEFIAVSGIAAGAQVVTLGKNRLADGVAVKLVEESQFTIRDSKTGGQQQ